MYLDSQPSSSQVERLSETHSGNLLVGTLTLSRAYNHFGEFIKTLLVIRWSGGRACNPECLESTNVMLIF